MEANCFWKLIETTIDIMCQLNIITCGKEHDVRKEGRKERGSQIRNNSF